MHRLASISQAFAPLFSVMPTRRQFLAHSTLFAAAFALPAAARAALATPEKSLSFYNTHTGETARSVFWANGEYLPAGLGEINKVLRDHRSGEIAPIDPRLLSLLDQLTAATRPGATLHVISGYRSPHSNQLLAEQSGGVAKRSLHMDGKAIDIRLPGFDLARLRDCALALQGGGVGFYPDSQFVHVDTGRVRRW